MNRRVRAWHEAQGIEMNPEVPFYVSKTELRLFSPENAKNLAMMISKMCSEIGEPALIIIDTFSRNFGGNENSNQDTATFFNNIIGVGGHGCGKLVVHHTGHDDNKTRGASNLLGDFDTRYKMNRVTDAASDIEMVKLTSEKMKDAEKADPQQFLKKVISFEGEDEEGNALQNGIF